MTIESTKAPNIPPNKEAEKAAPKASYGLPFLVRA